VNTQQLSATNTFTVSVVPTNTLHLYSLRMRPVSPDILGVHHPGRASRQQLRAAVRAEPR
jgi:hypothetical protein